MLVVAAEGALDVWLGGGGKVVADFGRERAKRGDRVLATRLEVSREGGSYVPREFLLPEVDEEREHESLDDTTDRRVVGKERTRPVSVRKLLTCRRPERCRPRTMGGA